MASAGCEREQWAYDEALELYQEALNELPTAEEVIEAEEHLEALKDLLIYVDDYPELFNDPERFKEKIEEDIEELEKVLEEYYSKIEIYLEACITLYHIWEILEECLSNLKTCEGCSEEFGPEYITTCKGCGGDYCDTCFDAGIEAWELKQQENV
ncbi:MAG: hypothetical protein OEX16_02190 [Hadesarchaea archaeon]|nr:hypothetical protein [Hadesarchaea archaeon]MDH5685389.1 hypothetical protein [Hadesarchaea archaeon]